MPYTTLSSGLTLQIPTRGTRTWADTILAECFSKISSHDHTGSGKGLAIGTSALSSNAVTTAKITDGNVTLAKLANIATDRLIGRDTAGTGVPEALTVSGGVEFSGSGGIQRSALTGDVTASAGSNATTIANLAVTTGKIDDLAVTTGKINDDAVTSDKLADNLVFPTAVTGVAGTAVASLALLSQLQNATANYCGAAGGTANALTITATPTPAAYANGQRFVFYATAENTAVTPTLNVNGLGAVNIVLDGGNLVPPYYFTNGEVLEVIYLGGNFYLVGHKSPYFKAHTFTLGTQAGSVGSITYTEGVGASIGKECSICFDLEATQATSTAAYWTIALPHAYKNVAYDTYVGGLFSIIAAVTAPAAYLMLPSGGGTTARIYRDVGYGGSDFPVGTYRILGHEIKYRTET